MPSPWVLLAATVPVVAGGLVYLGYSTEHSKVSDKQAQLAVVQTRLDRLASQQTGLTAQGSLFSLKGMRSVALQDALSKSMPWDVTLEDLARVLPKGVWFTSMSATSPTPAATASTAVAPTAAPAPGTAAVPQTFSLSGIAQNHDQVAELLERLSLLPMITNVTLSSTSTVTTAGPPAETTGGSAPAKPAKPAKPTLQFSLTAGVQQIPKAVDQ
jgi:Tfp pilus assembly protein PilN